jgi:hypothetical protein
MEDGTQALIIVALILTIGFLILKEVRRREAENERIKKKDSEEHYIAKGRREQFQKYWVEGITEKSDLANPANAIQRLGYEIGIVWLLLTEPRYRNLYNTYPPDWAWRRHFVLLRDGHSCKLCGERVTTLHTHHIHEISKGGTHELENLVTLCAGCHSDQHPENENLRIKAGRAPRRLVGPPSVAARSTPAHAGPEPNEQPEPSIAAPSDDLPPDQVLPGDLAGLRKMSSAREIVWNERVVYGESAAIQTTVNNFPAGAKYSFMPTGNWTLPPRTGIHFNSAVLQPHVGEETILVLREEGRFLEELRGKGAFDLRLNSGAIRTSEGPVLFLLWWFPPLVNDLPFAAYELLLNPLGSSALNLLHRAAKQSHLHLLMIDETAKLFDLIEFRNNYFLERLLEIAQEIGPDLGNYDFAAIQAAFTREIPQTDLFKPPSNA